MLRVIKSLRDEGTTVLLSAHQLELVEQLADRVFLLAHGRRVLSGTVPEVKASVHGGYSLQITFANPVDADTLQTWALDANLSGNDRRTSGTVRLTLENQATAAEWIERAMHLGPITEFRGGALSLHEIYLRALIVSPVRSEPAFASV